MQVEYENFIVQVSSHLNWYRFAETSIRCNLKKKKKKCCRIIQPQNLATTEIVLEVSSEPTGKWKRDCQNFQQFHQVCGSLNSKITLYNWYRLNFYKLSNWYNAEALNVNLVTFLGSCVILRIMCNFSLVCTQLSLYALGFWGYSNII